MNVLIPRSFAPSFPRYGMRASISTAPRPRLNLKPWLKPPRQFYSLSAGNVHRSQFAEAQRLTARYEAAREKSGTITECIG